MKKTLALLVSFTMILGSSCVLQAKQLPEDTQTKSFDINHDGKINKKDMKVLDRAFNTVSTDNKFNPAADLNNDNVVNMSDRMLLMKYFYEHNIPIPTMPKIHVTPVPTPKPTTPVTMNFDINRDGSVDIKDMEALDKAFNAVSADPNFDPAADLNNDSVINMSDKMLLMKYFHDHNIPVPTIPDINVTPKPTAPVTMNFDINRDGNVDIKDMEALDKAFNAVSADPNFDPAADLNNDSVINMSDKMLLMKYFHDHNIAL